MSLFRQLWLTVVVSVFVSFIGSFVSSMVTAKTYLEEQLLTQSTDNASSLALSMSHETLDQATIELMVSALFDNGHFRTIRFTNTKGQVVVEKNNPTAPDKVPEWFVSMFPILTTPATAQVSSGWMQAGTVTVIPHTRFAYQALWQGSIKLFLWIMLTGCVTGLLGSLVIRKIRQPVDKMVEQANGISEYKFVTINEPRTPELKSLVKAMNAMVSRVKNMLNEQATRIQQLRNEVSQDALTGLLNKNHFENLVENALKDDESPDTGAVFLLRLFDLASINKQIGRQKTDELIRAVGQQIQGILTNSDGLEVHAGKLAGADFGFLLPGERMTSASVLADQIMSSLETLHQQGIAPLANIGHIAITTYTQQQAASQIWVRLETLLVEAQNQGANLVRKDHIETTETEQRYDWVNEIKSALSTQHFTTVSFPVVRINGQLAHNELMLRLKDSKTGQLIPAGTFIPDASRAGLIPDLDLETIRLGIEIVESNNQAVAINLASESIMKASFVDELARLLSNSPKAANNLWLEVATQGYQSELDALTLLSRKVRPLGTKLGIEHFGRHFNSIPMLHEIGLDYLKIDNTFIRQIDLHAGNQNLVKAICSIAQSVGIEVYAERVETKAEWKTLSDIGLDGLTGPVVNLTN
ncbi:EAL domain-containing protein [Leeia sp. TBRC 13508]|uniref:EAL domain-containing protein n=1 Tax=Leeia speluncae TaxID=2884804 RepID=A0ABS8D8F8_9NEIS|nr:EAL domain-containing protein [Leeia speluncae]MCB6184459.1 EAL domain-containing protein [Leeia speluncae]